MVHPGPSELLSSAPSGGRGEEVLVFAEPQSELNVLLNRPGPVQTAQPYLSPSIHAVAKLFFNTLELPDWGSVATPTGALSHDLIGS